TLRRLSWRAPRPAEPAMDADEPPAPADVSWRLVAILALVLLAGIGIGAAVGVSVPARAPKPTEREPQAWRVDAAEKLRREARALGYRITPDLVRHVVRAEARDGGGPSDELEARGESTVEQAR